MRHDERNQLIGFEARRGGTLLKKSSYRYDAFNRRVASFADTDGDGNDDVVTYQVYGGQAAWQLLAEYDGAGDAANLLRSYIYGLSIDEVLSMRDHASDDDYFYHQDDLFSVYALTDADGAVVERYDYGDYGQVSIMEANGTPRAASAYDNRHTFTGRLLMPELTLDDGGQILEYRHRYMLASNGRFVQRDPLGYVDGMNLYQYALSGPLMRVDPLGLYCSQASTNCPLPTTRRPQWLPGDPIPGSLPGHPCWYKFSPVCSDGNWCRHVLRDREAEADRKFVRCVSPRVTSYIGAAAAAVTCQPLKFHPAQYLACVAAVLGLSVGELWNIHTCMTNRQHDQFNAENSYCGYLNWKARNCGRNHPEAPHRIASAVSCPVSPPSSMPITFP